MLDGVTIHKIEYTEKENKKFPEGLGNAHTHGMENYGLKNLCLGVDLSPERTSYILNKVSELMANPGENMDMSKIHYLHNENGIATLIFKLHEATCFNEPVIAIIMADVNKCFPGQLLCLKPYADQLVNHHDIVFE